MTRLVQCGWETGDINESGVTGYNYNAVASASPSPRSPGLYYMQCGSGSGGSWGARDFQLPAAITELWVRVAVYFSFGGSNEATIVAVTDPSRTIQSSVTWSSVDNFLRVRNGYGGTLLGTSTQTWGQNAWHLLEVHWLITSATSGTVEVWVDAVRWLNLTGVDNTASSTLTMQFVRLGDAGSGSMGAGRELFDDFAVNDTNGTLNNAQIGDGRVVLLKPNGAGSNTNQTRGGTDTGANWSQENELPCSMTQYVYSSTTGTRDTYALEDIPSTGMWSVNAIDVIAMAQNSDALAGSIGLTNKSGATTTEAAAQVLNTTAAYYHQVYETDPNTSTAWTNVAVNALEAGTTVR